MTESTLGDISKVMKTGKTPPSKNQSYFEDDFNWYTPGDILYTKYIISSQRHVSNSAVEEGKASLYDENSLLITCIGNIGRVGISKEKCASNQQITAITPIDEVNVEYLYYWFIKNQNLLSDISNNAVVPILNNRTLKSVKFNYPPLETQKRIAQILDDAAALRDTTAQLLKEYDLLAQSIFLEMLATNETALINAKDSFKYSQGQQFSIDKQIKENIEGYTRFLRITDYTQGDDLRYVKTASEKALIKKSDIVLVRYGASAGFVGFGKEGILANNLFKISFKEFDFNNIFLLYTFKSERFQKFIDKEAFGAAMPALSFKSLDKFTFQAPTLELQNQFADKIALIEQQKALAKQELQESKDLFNCLLQKAFKGELV